MAVETLANEIAAASEWLSQQWTKHPATVVSVVSALISACSAGYNITSSIRKNLRERRKDERKYKGDEFSQDIRAPLAGVLAACASVSDALRACGRVSLGDFNGAKARVEVIQQEDIVPLVEKLLSNAVAAELHPVAPILTLRPIISDYYDGLLAALNAVYDSPADGAEMARRIDRVVTQLNSLNRDVRNALATKAAEISGYTP